jgi:hypothetical protein
MIYNLLTAIAKLLKSELSTYLTQPDTQLTIAQPTSSPAEPFPKISIYSGKFTLEQSIKEPNLIKPYPEESRQEIIALREFTQEFFVDITDKNLSNIENLSSLILGIILTGSDDLIQQYNVSATTQYQSQQTSTTHLINQINIIEGNHKTSVNTLNFELKLQVKGQLKLLRNIQGTPGIIKTISIKQN